MKTMKNKQRKWGEGAKEKGKDGGGAGGGREKRKVWIAEETVNGKTIDKRGRHTTFLGALQVRIERKRKGKRVRKKTATKYRNKQKKFY